MVTLAQGLKLTEEEKQIVFRQIGDRILYSTGDSTSRVLPIKKKNETTYEISFGKKIDILSDSLYRIVARELIKRGEFDFVAELKDCRTQKVQVSFLYFSATDSITPCLGRDIPNDCYTLEITLKEKKESPTHYYIGSLILFVTTLSIYVIRRKVKTRETIPEEHPLDLPKDTPVGNFVEVGAYRFHAEKRTLTHGSSQIPLTDKETHLLAMLIEGVHEVQDRNYLMEELWGKKGLIVISKNLDVLVSKLRKKLTLDEQVKIVNVHGIGYKLEIPGSGVS